MNFFDSQEAARRKTRVLLVYYALAVVLIVGAFYFASRAVFNLGAGLVGADRQVGGGIDSSPAFLVLAWDPFWMLLTAGLSLAVIAGGTMYRRASLSDGGPSVARSAGGREIAPNSLDFNERRLLNIVEEVALASGVPVPRVFVLDGEPGINAFAAGFCLGDAAVAVTRGAMERLGRDELQGVVAHEFSHILNGDMRLNSWLIGVLFGILVTAIIGRGLMQLIGKVRLSANKKSGGGIVLFLFLSGLTFWVIGSVGVFFARMIQCSVSREREFLADASAVQFTRSPSGLAGALKRIGASGYSNAMHCSNRDELSHLLFASTSASGFDGLFATHPPLLERIQRIDPGFDGDYSQWALRTVPPAAAEETAALHSENAVENLVTGLGGAGMGEVSAFLRGLTPDLRGAVSNPLDAAGILYALLLSEDDAVRQRQRGRILALEGQSLVTAAERWQTVLRRENRAARRMVVELAVEGARHRDSASRAACVRLVRELAEADGEVSLFEYMLQGRVARRLSPLTGVSDVRQKPLPPDQSRLEAAVVLGMLAYSGQLQDDGLAEEAWRAGVARAPSFGIGNLLPDRSSCTLETFDRALASLGRLSPVSKGELVAACSAVVRADGALTQDETELLRAVADMLDMPLPQV